MRACYLNSSYGPQSYAWQFDSGPQALCYIVALEVFFVVGLAGTEQY
jgi:hypothetical protein